MKWLVLAGTNSAQEALDSFSTLNAIMNQTFGYPTVDKQTLTYAQPIAYPDPHVYQVAMPIEARCVSLLAPNQQAALVDPTNLMSGGWFSTTLKASISNDVS